MEKAANPEYDPTNQSSEAAPDAEPASSEVPFTMVEGAPVYGIDAEDDTAEHLIERLQGASDRVKGFFNRFLKETGDTIHRHGFEDTSRD